MEAAWLWILSNLGWSITIYLGVTLILYFTIVYLVAANHRYEGQSPESAASTAVHESLEWVIWLLIWPVASVLVLPFVLLMGVLAGFRTLVERFIMYLIRNVNTKEDMTVERYTLVRDSDGHRYVLPVSMVDEFYEYDEKIATFDPLSGEEYPDVDRYREFRAEGDITFTDPDY